MIQALLVAGMFGMFFLGALYLQRILGYDALEVGLAFLPATIVMGTLSLGFSEKLIMRFGPRTTLIPGVIMVGIGLLLFARTPVDGNYLTDLLAPMLLVGLGVGTSFPSLMTLAMSGATPEDSGLASGVVNTSMQVGGAIGLAVLATLAAAAHRQQARRRRRAARRAQLRLPPRLRDRRDPGRDRRRWSPSPCCAKCRCPHPRRWPNTAQRPASRRARARLLRGLIRPSGAPFPLWPYKAHRNGSQPRRAFDEAALDRVGGQLERALVGRCRLIVAAEPAQQVGAGGVQRVVVVEALDRFDQLQSRLAARRASPPRPRG